MTTRYICRQQPQGYWRINHPGGTPLAQGKWADILAIIRTIHARKNR